MLDFDLLAPLKRHAAAIVVFLLLLAAGLLVLNRQAVKQRAEMEASRYEAEKRTRDRQEKLKRAIDRAAGR